MISESGLQNAELINHLQALGFRAFLIGEALMRAADPETALSDLIAAAEERPAVNDEIGTTNDERIQKSE